MGLVYLGDGRVFIKNPFGISSFLDVKGDNNVRSQPKFYAKCILNALEHKNMLFGDDNIPMHSYLDPSANTWLNGFMKHSHPNTDPNGSANSSSVRKDIHKFIWHKNSLHIIYLNKVILFFRI